jgi:hypothetical protein
MNRATMSAAVRPPGPVRDPHIFVTHRQIFVMRLRPGCIEVGFSRSETVRRIGTISALDLGLQLEERHFGASSKFDSRDHAQSHQ